MRTYEEIKKKLVDTRVEEAVSKQKFYQARRSENDISMDIFEQQMHDSKIVIYILEWILNEEERLPF